MRPQGRDPQDTARSIRRRTLLATAVTLAAPGGAGLAACSSREGPEPPARTADAPVIVTGEFRSRFRRGLTTSWRLALPPGTDPDHPRDDDGAPLPVCVVLHGRGGTCATLVHDGYEDALAAGTRRSGAALALAALDGGDGYWHARRTGEDAGRTLAEEFLPMLSRRGLAAAPGDRIGLAGLSMGGYGAILLAETWRRSRVAAVSVMSPALWLDPAETPAGAFDDREDFVRHDVFRQLRNLDGIAVRVDCGRSDPFYRAARAFTARRPAVTGNFDTGGHSVDYWRGHSGRAVEFIVRHLARKGGPSRTVNSS